MKRSVFWRSALVCWLGVQWITLFLVLPASLSLSPWVVLRGPPATGHWPIKIVQGLLGETVSYNRIKTDLEDGKLGFNSCPATIYLPHLENKEVELNNLSSFIAIMMVSGQCWTSVFPDMATVCMISTCFASIAKILDWVTLRHLPQSCSNNHTLN